MTYFVGHGGQVTVNNPDGVALAVTITGPANVYSDAARSSTVSFPDSITASKTYYFAVNDDAAVSVTRNGDTVFSKTVGVREGKAYSFTPDVDQYVGDSGYGAWTAYTPTLAGTGWDADDATPTGGYVRVGQTVHFWAKVVLGTAGTAGSVSPTVTLPVTAVADTAQLTGYLVDEGTAEYVAFPRQTSTTVVTVNCTGTAGVLDVTDTTTPFTWAPTDSFLVFGTYEAA